MMTSLYTGVTGLNANGTAMSVIGDNISNLNTTGFKSSRPTFADILSSSGVGSSSQVGRGVLVSSVSPLFTQGSFQNTASGLDLAIDGEGFFMVSDGAVRYYTRAGQFGVNRNGNVVNPDGLTLQGFLVDSSGTRVTGSIGDIGTTATQSPPNATSLFNIAFNLNADVTVTSTEAYPDYTVTTYTGGNTYVVHYNWSTTVTVYDSLGGAHDVTIYAKKTATGVWELSYVYDDPSTTMVNDFSGTSVLSFNSDGGLVEEIGTTAGFHFIDGVTTNQTIEFDYGMSITQGGTGFSGTTQFASPFAVLSLSQDGYKSGSLKGITIDSQGYINGTFTNGQTRLLGQVALARFTNPDGLTKMGRNIYAEAYASGPPIVAAAETSGMGRVLSNTLELSNVDLAEEFVKMISAQRGFEASSRIITTSDTMIGEVVNLKR